jgi:hypothetical protein
MIFGSERSELRRMYAEAWRKQTAGEPMSPLECQIAEVVALHPEYQSDVTADDIDQDYRPEGGKTNPYLHMGLHLGLREQIATNRPAGIAKLFERLQTQLGDSHRAEHDMIDCLAETLWEAQSQNRAPDEQLYLERLRRLAAK